MRKVVALIILLATLSLLDGCSKPDEKRECAVCGQLTTSTICGGKTMLESMGIPFSKMESMSSVVYSVYICDSCREKLKTTLF